MSYDLDRGIDEFHRRLHALTPVARGTAGLIAANVLVYVAMVARGENGLWADARPLVAWGANFGPLTRAEWWRLLTAAFLHGGLLHLGFNLLALRSGGPLLERSLGTARFLSVYALTAVAASVASVLASGHAVSVGASGAIFGVYGALLGIALRQAPPSDRWRYLKPGWGAPAISEEDLRRAEGPEAGGALVMPAYVARLLSTQIVGLALVNLLIGLVVPLIDNAAHVAGLLAGLVLGWLGAGAVSARLASAAGESVGPPGGALVDRSGWFVPAAALVSGVLALNAAFPMLPARTRLAVLDAGCALRSGSACVAAAREVRQAARGALTPPARTYLERGCTHGNGSACTALGVDALSAARVKAALAAFESACALHDAAGCRALALVIEAGRGVPADPARAMVLYARACERKDPFSCLRLAEATLRGRGVARDPRRGQALALQACDLGEPRGCTVYASERLAAKDVAAGLTFMERACQGQEPIACMELGTRRESGNGVPRDVQRAASVYYARACSAGLGPACTRAGGIFERAPGLVDLRKAAGYYEQGCRFGHAESCFNAGVMHAQGRGAAKDAVQASKYYELACLRGMKQACGLVVRTAPVSPATARPR